MENNLLLITFDQWRGDWADPYEPIIELPCLKFLSQNAWVARRCYTSSPQCVPARLSWLTGLFPSQLGVTKNQSVYLPEDAPSMIRELQKYGWYTSIVGKTHWTSHDSKGDLRKNIPLMKKLGFDEVLEVAGPRALRRLKCDLTDDWEENGVINEHMLDLKKRYDLGLTQNSWKVRPTVLPNNLYPDCWITEKSVEKLKNMPYDKPWLLWVSFVGPHEPFDTPLPWHGKNNPENLPTANSKPEWINNLPSDCQIKITESKWDGKITYEEIKECRGDYADHLSLLDDQIKKLLDELDLRSDKNKTAIVVTADHGEMLGDAGMLYKGTFLEGAVRVPWIYRPAPNEFQENNDLNIEKFNNTPLPLTGLLQKTFSTISKGEKTSDIIKWANEQELIVVEFAGELLLLKKNMKLIIGKNGDPLWAIDLENDPKEQIDLISNNPKKWKDNPKLKELYELGIKEYKRRKKPDWIWRVLDTIQ